MGGTFIRLCEQGHEVHVAYQTSGNIAVLDEAALRHADFVARVRRAFGLGDRQAERSSEHDRTVRRSKKQPGEVDSPELQQIKAPDPPHRGPRRRPLLRRQADDHIHFLDMPFYETGRVRKQPLGEAGHPDHRSTCCEKVKPHQIYAAGDLSDPHGTHRVCLAAIIEAVRRLQGPRLDEALRSLALPRRLAGMGRRRDRDGRPLSAPTRCSASAWRSSSTRARRTKPCSPAPATRREFWQRAEDRNRDTAALYDKLGLAEYEAIEGFVRLSSIGDGAV